MKILIKKFVSYVFIHTFVTSQTTKTTNHDKRNPFQTSTRSRQSDETS